jgi:hypothetical protein
MTCTETRDLFSALADDALTPTERAALDAHLAGCAECRRELAGLLRTMKLVRAMDPARAPAGFVDRVLAAAQPAPWPTRLARRLGRPWPTVPLGAAALLLIGGLAVLLFRGSLEQRRAAQIETPAPGPTAPPPSRERGVSDAVVARKVEPSAPTPPATSEPASPSPAPETPQNRREPPAAAAKRAESNVEPSPPARDAAPAARAMSERPATTPPAIVERPRAPSESVERAPDKDNAEGAKLRRDAGSSVAQGRAESSAADRQTPTPRGGATPSAPAIAAAKAQPIPQIAPLSRTGPRTGIPAAPPDVTAELRVADVSTAERSLIELAARVGGRQTGRRIDAGRVVVELAVPRDAYAQFVREAAALGAVAIGSQATERPTLAVGVTLSN